MRQEVVMPTLRPLVLSEPERQALLSMRDHDPKSYRRERAAALLKVADGMPAAQVARGGLLRRRQPDTIYAWLDRYEAEGIAGLDLRPGRGRKPAFSPSRRGSSHRTAALAAPRAYPTDQERNQ